MAVFLLPIGDERMFRMTLLGAVFGLAIVSAMPAAWADDNNPGTTTTDPGTAPPADPSVTPPVDPNAPPAMYGVFRENVPDVANSQKNCWTQIMDDGGTINGELLGERLNDGDAQKMLQCEARMHQCANARTAPTWTARADTGELSDWSQGDGGGNWSNGGGDNWSNGGDGSGGGNGWSGDGHSGRGRHHRSSCGGFYGRFNGDQTAGGGSGGGNGWSGRGHGGDNGNGDNGGSSGGNSGGGGGNGGNGGSSGGNWGGGNGNGDNGGSSGGNSGGGN